VPWPANSKSLIGIFRTTIFAVSLVLGMRAGYCRESLAKRTAAIITLSPVLVMNEPTLAIENIALWQRDPRRCA
jgi:hypothetical protein